jgi:hypothetical protein
VDKDDHRAGGLLHDLLDQREGVLGALSQPDQRDVRSLPGGHGSDVVDLDLAGDHLVPERGDDRRHEGQPILSLVRDQHTQMLGLAIAHRDSGGPKSSHGPHCSASPSWYVVAGPEPHFRWPRRCSSS